jgi:hypothetical protein
VAGTQRHLGGREAEILRVGLHELPEVVKLEVVEAHPLAEAPECLDETWMLRRPTQGDKQKVLVRWVGPVGIEPTTEGL